MNLFRFIKEAAAFRKALKTSIAQQQEKDAMALTMTAEELSALSDDDLLQAVFARIHRIVDSHADISAGFQALNQAQRIVYAVNYLEMEVNNGGLCQFFVNSSRMLAPVVSEYMGILGAAEHKQLYDDFIKNHQINVHDLSSFAINSIADFQERFERYPFSEYDDVFYKMAPLEQHLLPFIREHIDQM